ncbi:hypothetical protein FNN08_05840 [Thalassomonas sp. M1454]|nr:hypothetical protein FNN08_05840 [Thalassomonas sp. M1454]
MSRIDALTQIITFGELREHAFSQLVKFSYGNDVSSLEVSNLILSEVLTKYLSDVISADDLEEWANFIECRDDLEFTAIEGFVYALANPEQMGEISKANIDKMLKMLNSSL